MKTPVILIALLLGLAACDAYGPSTSGYEASASGY